MGGRGSSSSFSSFLGRRGKAATIEEATKRTNPHYFEEKKWQTNCQRCVFAYEMQRRGYDVEALPRIMDGTDTLPYGDREGGWKQVMSGMEQANMPSRNTIKAMSAQMAKWGNGARAIVRVTWKGRGSGHVFIAEQVNGVTRYTDPQCAFPMNIKSYMDGAIKGETQLYRIDNAKPTKLLSKCVKRR